LIELNDSNKKFIIEQFLKKDLFISKKIVEYIDNSNINFYQIGRLVEVSKLENNNKVYFENIKQHVDYMMIHKFEVPRKITRQQRYDVLKRQKWDCNSCGCKLKYNKYSKWGNEVAHIDHIHPYSERFSYSNGCQNINETSNLQALCPNCNLSKGKKRIN
jgi:5-methylcytosine-specific restriction endonuclease McrA